MHINIPVAIIYLVGFPVHRLFKTVFTPRRLKSLPDANWTVPVDWLLNPLSASFGLPQCCFDIESRHNLAWF